MTPEKIATLLLEIKAITLNVKQPYRYASGILSPIYCDNRLVISYPDKRELLVNAFIQAIKDTKLKFDVVAGTATAGIAHAAWIADRLQIPMVYVRSSEKKHGKTNQIEGVIHKGQTVLVIEDLISTGHSALNAATALREAGATVNDCLAIFTYEMPAAIKHFAEQKIQLITLSNFSTLMKVAVEQHYLNKEEEEQARRWNRNPEHWQA